MNTLYLIVLGVIDLIIGFGASLASLFILASHSFHVKGTSFDTVGVNNTETAHEQRYDIWPILIKSCDSALLVLFILQILMAIFVLHSFGSFLISESKVQCRILKMWLILKIVLIVILISSFIVMKFAFGIEPWLLAAAVLNVGFAIFIYLFHKKLNEKGNSYATCSNP